MRTYITKRLLLMLVTLVAITLVAYVMIRVAPGDPAKSHILGSTGAELFEQGKEDSEIDKQLRHDFYLDRNPFIGYSLWLRDIVIRHDLKRSIVVSPGKPVLQLIAERIPYTLRLNLAAICVMYLLAVPIGIYSAFRHRTWSERAMTLFMFVLYSLPNFWVGLLLLVFFASDEFLNWFPLGGLSPETSRVWGMSSWRILFETARYYVLPVVCLTYGGLAGLSRYARTGMLEIIRLDYIRTARAKGLSEWYVIMKHALRNSLIPLVTIFAGLLPGLISGSVVVEYIYNIPGMGSLSLLALSSRDYPLIMVLFSIGAILTLLGIFVSDMLYVLVDPRISFE